MFVVVLVPAMMAVAGLVIDGGYALAARQEARSAAEQAARAGADALSTDSLRASGRIALDQRAAVTAANAYLSRVGRDGTATVSRDEVTVTVRVVRRTAVLCAIGIESVASTATATAIGITGIDRPELTDSSEASR